MRTPNELRQQAWDCHQRGDLSQAEQCYRALIDQGKTNNCIELNDAVNLGALYRQQGRLKDAINHYDQCLLLLPSSEHLSGNAINACIAAGLHEKAVAIGEQTLQHQPNNPALQEAIGRALIAGKAFDKAERLFNTLLEQDPNDLNHLLGLGQSYFYQDHWPKAEQVYRKLHALYPEDSRGPANLIICLKEQGRFQEALALIETLPDELQQHQDIIGSRASLNMAAQDFAQAEQILRAACRQDPDNSVNWLNHAACLRSLKHNNAALQVLRQALLRHPENRDLKLAYSQSLAELGREKIAMKLLLLDADGDNVVSTQYLNNVQFLGMGYQVLSSAQCRTMAQAWEHAIQQKAPGPLWADRQREPPAGRRLRVGYLSADFCNHPVGRFLLPIVEGHNRNAVEVIGLNLCPHDDALHRRFQGNFDGWIDLRFLSDLDAARRISDAQLDVLVELGGFTDGNRLGMLVHRPAPVQLSYLGYCGPTFLSSIDGWIGDATLFGGLNSIDRSAHHLHHLNGGYMAYVPEGLPELSAPEPGRPFRFGCFNHSRKLSQGAIDLFVRVLKAVPDAELLLKSITFVEVEEQRRLQRLFLQAGLAPERLKIQPHVQGWDRHMALYAAMDVALDPLPYSGATTSCEALLMGVPVVSLAGASMAERLSASVLAGAGLNDWMATSPEQYVAIAQQLAGAPARMRSLEQRQQLRHQVQTSALGDPQRLTRELEALFQGLSVAQAAAA